MATHCCEETIYLSNSDTVLENNSLIYIYKNNSYEIYKIKNVIADAVLCHPVGSFPVIFPEIPELNCSSIGIFKQGGIMDDIVSIKREKIAGKVICVSDYFVTCPNNILREK